MYCGWAKLGVELDKLAGDPVDVYVNDRLVRQVGAERQFRVRINDIISVNRTRRNAEVMMSRSPWMALICLGSLTTNVCGGRAGPR